LYKELLEDKNQEIQEMKKKLKSL